MVWLFQPLLQLIARSTDSEMARQLEFLKAENAMLRKRLGRSVRLTDEEKSLLVKLGEQIGAGVKALLTIVLPVQNPPSKNSLTHRGFLETSGPSADPIGHKRGVSLTPTRKRIVGSSTS